MKIGPVTNEFISNGTVRVNKEQPLPDKKKNEKIDTVEISDDSRNRLAQRAEEVQKIHVEEALSLKYLKIRNRIDNGFYETEEFKDLLIDRLTDQLFTEE